MKNIHLRHVLQAAISSEDRGRDFYTALAGKVTDPETKDLCHRLAKDESEHKMFIESMLNQWLPLSPDRDTSAMMAQKMKEWDIFANPPDMGSTEDVMVKYAIEQEIKMADLYLSFEKYFPDAWRMMSIHTLVMTERSHANKLKNVF